MGQRHSVLARTIGAGCGRHFGSKIALGIQAGVVAFAGAGLVGLGEDDQALVDAAELGAVLDLPGGSAGGAEGGQQDADQQRDDRDDHQQFDKGEAEGASSGVTSGAIDRGVTLKKLDFGYRVTAESGAEPKWMPRRVFTDGRKTYIGFPRDLATTSAPPLFVLGREGEAQLVNYRVKGGYYVIDQVIERAELRLGKEPQQVVSIIRMSK